PPLTEGGSPFSPPGPHRPGPTARRSAPLPQRWGRGRGRGPAVSPSPARGGGQGERSIPPGPSPPRIGGLGGTSRFVARKGVPHHADPPHRRARDRRPPFPLPPHGR